jgi:hypothetical protein
LISHPSGIQKFEFADFNYYSDLVSAIKKSKKENKPILVEFTCYACLADRNYEDRIFRSRTVLEKIKCEYVFVRLFVDDRSPFNEAEIYFGNKKAKYFGQIWVRFQQEKVSNVSQPYFALFDSELNIISSEFQNFYLRDPGDFLFWLEGEQINFSKSKFKH